MTYTVAVRALCEFAARRGDLDLRFTPAPSALEGKAGHILVQSRRGEDYEAEISLVGEYRDLKVRGRADGFDAKTGQLEEIKTYHGTLNNVRAHHSALHWAQARIYGHLLCQARGLARLRIALVYFNVGTEEETVLAEMYEAGELQTFFEDLCGRFLAWAHGEAAHREARDEALTALKFPMERFRTGQRDLAVAVYRCARSDTGGRCLMAQASTGIGKTLGTIFPMLKGSTGEQLCSKSSVFDASHRMWITRLPWFARLNNRVDDRQQLMHARDQRDFLWFTRRHQSAVERLHHRIKARSAQRRHINRGAYARPAAPSRTLALELATVAIKGGDPHQLRYLAPIQSAQLWQCTHQHGLRVWPHALHALEKRQLVFKVLFELTAHVALDMPDLLVQHLEHSDNALALPGVRAVQTVALSYAHRYQLSASIHHRHQQLLLRGGHFVEQAAALVTCVQRARKLRQRLRIRAVRLGQVAQSLGKVMRLPGVDHHDAKAMSAKRRRSQTLKPASGFEHHAGHTVKDWHEQRQQSSHGFVIIAQSARLCDVTACNLQGSLGDINANKYGARVWRTCKFRNVCHRPSLQIRGLPKEKLQGSQQATVRARSKRSVIHAKCSPTGLSPRGLTGCGQLSKITHQNNQSRRYKGLDKVFFLTAKGTGHGLALAALDTFNTQLKEQPSRCQLRVLDVQARDKVCEHPDKACHGDSCPLAQGFFDRLPAARAAAIEHSQPWDAEAVRSVARANHVCPYYLAQELVRWSDVVVADYNYYYDTTAMLYALTQAEQWKVGVLVDEAHNLLERARRMYTAELSQFSLVDARQAATGLVRKALDRLHRNWNALNREQADSYRVYEEVPAAVLAAVQGAVGAIADAQIDSPLLPGDPVLTFYWELLQFLALAADFGSHALCDLSLASGRTGRNKAPTSTLCIRNVFPAPHLAARHAAAHACVLFSGTLNPPHFYRDVLGLPADTDWIEVDAPFKAQQLSVRAATDISTRYHDREKSLQPIVDLVAQQYARQPGNYLCFFSSFDYLQRVAQCMQCTHPQMPVWLQTPAMDDSGRSAFLARFTEQGQGIGFAVLGGAFSEGVDLPGQRLIGAFVATLGLPQVNPINEQMKRAMDRQFGADKGYDYTYLYPGLRKVVQAAGRVIRSEQDRGVVFLIDDRFMRREVRALLPRWWKIDG